MKIIFLLSAIGLFAQVRPSGPLKRREFGGQRMENRISLLPFPGLRTGSRICRGFGSN